MKINLLITLQIFLALNVLTAQTPTGLTPVTATILANVPEAADYGIVYELGITNNSYYTGTAIPYTIDHSNELNTNHNRVAYYMQLDTSWIWVSMDDFASGNLPQLGIPKSQTNNVAWETGVNNMNVFTNKSGIIQGQNISTGNLEIWSNNALTNANSNIGGSGSAYDFDDSLGSVVDDYGSFQVHNHGAQQTLFAFNGFHSSFITDVGIGNHQSGSDWTLSGSVFRHTIKKLYVLVGKVCVSSTGTDVQTACGSYTWIDGVTYTANDSSATDTLTNAAGCDSIITLNLTITNIDVSTSTSSPVISANNTTATSYQWIDCNDNSSISGETSATFTVTQNGDYAVVITEGNCSDTSNCVTISDISTAGIDENSELNVSIYPNPTKGEFTIQTLNGIGMVNIYSIDGKLIKELKTTSTNSLINVNNLEKGVYLVNVISALSQKTIRLVVD